MNLWDVLLYPLITLWLVCGVVIFTVWRDMNWALDRFYEDRFWLGSLVHLGCLLLWPGVVAYWIFKYVLKWGRV